MSAVCEDWGRGVAVRGTRVSGAWGAGLYGEWVGCWWEWMGTGGEVE